MLKPEKTTKLFVEDRDTGAKSSLPEFNQLRVKTVDNGIGKYLVIKTERWALDEENLEELFLELRNMLKGANAN